MGLLDRIAARRHDTSQVSRVGTEVEEPVFPTKALRKFIGALSTHDSPTLLDLAPVVGANVNFFGEHLNCKVLVEDIFAELERHSKANQLDALPKFLSSRFPQPDNSVDGILCWDLMDYLDRPAAHALADQLIRLLKPDGALLAFFGTAQPRDATYTRYVIVDEASLKHRHYPATRARQSILANRDVIRLFERLRVSESFLLQNNLREILFRKPAYNAG